MNNTVQPIKLITRLENKGWGYEIGICNNEEFCGKILHFNEGSVFSFHAHFLKREVFFVLIGSVKLEYFDLTNANRKEMVLKKDDVIEIPRLCFHKITALKESKIIEFSTHHDDSDSFRIEKGNTQTKNLLLS